MHAEDGLTDRERVFCVAYVANGFNAAAAYRVAFPDALPSTVYASAGQYLGKARVREHLERAFTKVLGKLEAMGAEMLGRVVLDARADLRDVVDPETGALLPVQLWPDRLANSVEAFEALPGGRYKVKLVSKAAARRTLLEITGKMKNPIATEVSALARAIRNTLSLPEPGTSSEPQP